MKNSFLLKYSLTICIAIVAVSCNKNTSKEIVGCDLALSPLILPFNVLDVNSGQDLFFSTSPRYETNAIYFFSIRDKTRKDTIRPAITGTATNRIFTVQINNTAIKDTLLMKVATNPDDIIIYEVKKGDGPCGGLAFDKVYFNGTQLTANNGKFNFLK